MRLHLPAFLSLAAFFASLLLLSQSSLAAPTGDQGASSSRAAAQDAVPLSPTPPFLSPENPSQRPHRLPGSPSKPRTPMIGNNGLFVERPPIDDYIKYLDINRIRTSSNNDIYNKQFANTALPMFRNMPLFSSRHNPGLIEQALKRYNAVVIVDQPAQQARVIRLKSGSLQVKAPQKSLQRILTLYEMHPGVHRVKKFLTNPQRHPPRTDRDVDRMPHAWGEPIMVPDEFDQDDMHVAASRGGGSFWLQHKDRGYLSINPSTLDVYKEPTNHAAEEIARVLRGYDADKKAYDKEFASLRWGAPLNLEVPSQTQSTLRAFTTYPRFASNVVNRQEMIDALQEHGRFHLYKKSRGRSEVAYKVTLARDAPMYIQIKPLSTKERLGERVMSVLGKIRKP
ncbi:uncharacterized protein SRS1_11238 [Sporisorium reilianum f. sp. reilianum]|uniref:Effector family protein Eff1 n=1 Tax=Sporisorium reilianum f. sp. reilianum TaxID=72559 RepID=A0A2N8UGU7_9BASI|nr:uncharacterized protein SRS1_11238 [Sporisorium reilianum f. sp. reilianum]